MNMMTVANPSPSRPIPLDAHRAEPRWTRDQANKYWLRDKAKIEAEKAPRTRLALPIPALLAHIDRAIEVSGVSPAAFSRGVTSHSDLLTSIRAGAREPRRLLRLRMEDYATLLIDQARERALSVLLDGLGERGVAEAVDRLIDLLDRRAGDTDLEEIDEREPDCDGKGDVAWPEWHTRGRQKVVDRLAGFHEPMPQHAGVGMAQEDDEDDDPREDNGDERDGNRSEEDFMVHNTYYPQGPGCPVSDPAGDRDEDLESGGHCLPFGIDQRRVVGEAEAFHDLNGIRLLRVAQPGNDQ
jgi:hypothetical protein